MQGVKKSQKQGIVSRRKSEKCLKKETVMARQIWRKTVLWAVERGKEKERKIQRRRKGAMNFLRKDHKHSTKARTYCFSANSTEMWNEKIGRATLLHRG